MLEQLISAGEKLRTSFDNYLGVCSILQDYLSQGKILPGLPQDLSAGLQNEFAFILSYEQKIQQARVAIGHARNYFTSVTPINKLPSEIMSRIFHLVSENPCRLPPSNDIGYYPNHTHYPDWLAQVCSRWRKIALSSPSLWTHIDLTPHLVLGRGVFDRTGAYTERAGKTPYEIHIDDKGCTYDDHYQVDKTVSYLASHLKALEFTITAHGLLPYHSSVFQCLILNCKPETFKILRVHSDSSLPYPFIKCCDDTSWEDDNYDTNIEILASNLLQLAESPIDHQLAGLYHGLVDLRLTSPSNGNVPVIFRSELVSVLTGSPGLKILHFSLDLFLPEVLEDKRDYPLDPVPLQDLEEVYISAIQARHTNRTTVHVSSLLCLLAPGSKPLRLALESIKYKDVGSDDTREFLARSKVEKLWIRRGFGSMAYLQFSHLPDMQVLVFDSCAMRSRDTLKVALGPCTWIIHDTTIDWSDLRSIVKSCPVKLVLSLLKILDDGVNAMPEKELRAAFPTAQFLEQGLRLDHATDWDVVDRCVLSNGRSSVV